MELEAQGEDEERQEEEKVIEESKQVTGSLSEEALRVFENRTQTQNIT